ncbi:hypothetical protein CCACVL1_14315 [Corchorus capsularis]|uniref:Uncharacterized protein n=1 Tax=Corchorus capsularis TaxID=210143 RepID=A0A1R3I7K3_COCAP|nr:hypothetical protein CCACVL1_14315 [Corchorus capsularis]
MRSFHAHHHPKNHRLRLRLPLSQRSSRPNVPKTLLNSEFAGAGLGLNEVNPIPILPGALFLLYDNPRFCLLPKKGIIVSRGQNKASAFTCDNSLASYLLVLKAIVFAILVLEIKIRKIKVVYIIHRDIVLSVNMAS